MWLGSHTTGFPHPVPGASCRLRGQVCHGHTSRANEHAQKPGSRVSGGSVSITEAPQKPRSSVGS